MAEGAELHVLFHARIDDDRAGEENAVVPEARVFDEAVGVDDDVAADAAFAAQDDPGTDHGTAADPRQPLEAEIAGVLHADAAPPQMGELQGDDRGLDRQRLPGRVDRRNGAFQLHFDGAGKSAQAAEQSRFQPQAVLS